LILDCIKLPLRCCCAVVVLLGVLCAGSDGLWDNVYSSELQELVPSSPAGIDAAADKIAKLARRHAADPEFASPYTAEAKAQG
jgi:hypothetical protein